MPSGPAARELPLLRMARATISVVKGEEFLSSGHFLRRCRLTRRALGSVLWETMEVNCLLNAVAMSRFEVSVLLLKVMGWLGDCLVVLPERVFMIDQK